MKPTYKDLQQRIAELEQALANYGDRQETFQKTLIDNIPLAITIYDENGRILYANENTEKLLSLEKGSMAGKTVFQVYPRETAEDQVRLIRQVIETGQPVNTDRIIDWKGKTMHLKVARQPLLNERGQVTSVLAISQNITEQIRQEKLLNIQYQIDLLINFGTDLNYSFDLVFQYLMSFNWIDGGSIYHFNEVKDRLDLIYSKGIPEKIISRLSSIPLIHPHAKFIMEKIPDYVTGSDFLSRVPKEMTDEGFKTVVIIPLIFHDEVIGTLNLASYNAQTIDESDKRIVESIASRLANLIMLVETQIKLDKTNHELNARLQEINIKQQMLIQKSRLESLGELAAGLAHEMYQPLSVISFAMENIQYKLEQKKLPEEYLISKFQTINQNINKISVLIDHVRIFSRDQGSITFEQVDVNQVINNALSMIGSQLKNNQIQVITELSDAIGYTIGNSSRFEQVILNLISNARDALEEKENEAMSGSLLKEIRIKTAVEKKRIIVRVWDCGNGIPSLNIDKIFNPFFTTKVEGKGTGLGLAIVYGIISEMKGDISVRTVEGKFTEISINLPHYAKKIK
jgi:PAS domain S-box-containing protein